MIHIYFGGGKGKTTAACGLAVRAAGAGRRVLFCQFLKSGESCERLAMRRLEDIEWLGAPMDGFLFQMGADERSAAEAAQRDVFRDAAMRMKCGRYGLVVLDEVLWLAVEGIVPERELVCALKAVPEGCEVVLTGASAPEKVLACADYVTEMRKVKHPFDRGARARRGVEF